MKSCPYSENIISYRMGMLENSEKEKFETHLKGCPICQREYEIETAISHELSEEFKPRDLEHIVLTRVRLLKSYEVPSLKLDLIKGGLYAAAFVVIGLLVLPWIIDFPYARLLDINLNLDFSIEWSQLSTLITTNLTLMLALGAIFTILSSAYSLILVRK